MKAIEITAPGKPEVLRLADRPAPQVGAGELLIKVAAAGVNRPDVLQRKGLYPVPPGASDIPGLEVAGTIVEGDKAAMVAAGFAVGDRVCALVAGGGYAELCAAPVEQCLPVPEGLSDIEAASLPETFFTVWSNVFERGRLQPGETLLVHGGTSGIGVTAIQLGKAFGATVIATAGSDDKCAACLKLGADHAINYKTHDFVAEVQRLTNQRGTDVILDMVAGDYLARDLQCLADDGRVVIIAVQGGTKSQIDAGAVLRRRLTITGSTLRARPVEEKAQLSQRVAAEVMPAITSGALRVVIDSVLPIAEVRAAHKRLEASAHVGKIVLVIP